jgi:hypothetical protein
MSHWYYNTSSGDLANEGGPLGTIVGLLNTNTPGLGWHELHIPGTATEAHAAAPTTSTGKALLQQAGSTVGGAGSLLGLPQLSNLRDLMVRTVKVVIGALLIIIGVNSLLKQQGIDVPKPPAVIPV